MEFPCSTLSFTLTKNCFADGSRKIWRWAPRRFVHLPVYVEAARTWLHTEAHVIDTQDATAEQVARTIAKAVEIRDRM